MKTENDITKLKNKYIQTINSLQLKNKIELQNLIDVNLREIELYENLIEKKNIQINNLKLIQK